MTQRTTPIWPTCHHDPSMHVLPWDLTCRRWPTCILFPTQLVSTLARHGGSDGLKMTYSAWYSILVLFPTLFILSKLFLILLIICRKGVIWVSRWFLMSQTIDSILGPTQKIWGRSNFEKLVQSDPKHGRIGKLFMDRLLVIVWIGSPLFRPVLTIIFIARESRPKLEATQEIWGRNSLKGHWKQSRTQVKRESIELTTFSHCVGWFTPI